ncbi:MAG: S8 family serine peptidase [Thermoleophilia bacterium]
MHLARPAALAATVLASLAIASAPALGSGSVAVELAPGVAPSALGVPAEPALSSDAVAALSARAGRLGNEVPEIGRWYTVPVHPDRAGALADRLDAKPGVSADVAYEPAAPPAACRAGRYPYISAAGAVPDLSGFQDYRAGLSIPAGADGAGVRLTDMEYDWNPAHVDLAGRSLGAAAVPPGGYPSDWKADHHGTAVLTLLAGSADGQGVTGLVAAADVRAVSPYSPERGGFVFADTIARAAADLRPGDVLLLEQQVDVDPGPATVLAPIEADAASRDAIRLAVASGITVVEPAGNGDVDLDSLGIPWLTSAAGALHSGAIVVAAGRVADRGRASLSNYGSRVDVQGWGEQVVAGGYGTGMVGKGDPNRLFTACFDGTSSASATVAGAITALQGLSLTQRGGMLDPAQVREAIVATGLPQAAGEPRIGPRPQVAAAAEYALRLPAHATASVRPAVDERNPATESSGAVLASRPVVTRVRASFRRGVLVVTLRDLAPRAVVRVAGKRVRAPAGRAVVRGLRAGRLKLTVTAPRRADVGYRAAAYTLTVKAAGAVRVARASR